ncbi:hypothetical protein BC477_15160 [Clavibacter michiganensis subsp. michiganensis]|uniref:Uncharacterized protein n=1 Tax=Clavibacter michiganensis subsp. michiganensis TaxID=33013 RepID=A0A251XCP7_CLAMM|nr:hypothetical protein BC477_15160 [Clavibacter michiganensis subsp. michiganensis]OUD99822.1 hypothetical protein CMMCAS07_20320 [Clavibacter michiganensis subsp. michiganensis]
MARPRPASSQSCRSRRARSTCHGAMPSFDASWPDAPETPETLAIVRIFIAKAAMSGTGSAPR